MAAVDFASKRFEHFPVQESSFFHPDKEDRGSEHNFSISVPAFDIWKKFEFIPTPPLSPSRIEPEYSFPLDEQELEAVADTLEMLTEVANDSSQATATLVAMSESAISTRSLKSKLIQDCMWNGASYELSGDFGSPAIVEACYETPCSTPPPVEYVSSDCVDPSAVFPYPINETQMSCGPQQCSDSEEEIDVVTIEKPRKRNLSNGNDQVPSVPTKRMRSAAVKAKPASPTPVVTKIVPRRQASTASSNSGSDEEDNDKRATHNVLERKRRNDLKTSFHSLRDEVPDIKENERAPKVLILKKAKEHIEKLVSEELNLLAELEKERNRNQRLQEKFFLLGQKRK